jgi:tRNA-Thr(GGU) m(6)t(6)A37 methyltransferase TsaA
MDPIGLIKSGYKQRFAIPRQPGLAKNAVAEIRLDPKFSLDSVRGIDEFSHLWILFKFHDTKGKTWKEVVRPPRLGGKEGRGVFATRSPFRPNPIGLSVVKLLSLDKDPSSKEILIKIEAGDFLDGTPVYDVKPYVPYADSVASAESNWAQTSDETIDVALGDEALKNLDKDALELFNNQKDFIIETISFDPRHAHERGRDGLPEQTWGVLLSDFDVKWKVENNVAVIVSIKLAIN